jgi:hypothetical protein
MYTDDKVSYNVPKTTEEEIQESKKITTPPITAAF